MRNVKKILSLILMACMVLSLLPVAARAAESDFAFDSATGTITKYNGPGGDVVIPSTIGGVSVTAIGEKAFYKELFTSDTITSVIIPSGVTTIGFGAFGNRNKIIAITIPSTVTSIGDYAFIHEGFGRSSLSKVYFLGTNAVTMGTNIFFQAQADFKIYYESGKAGFSDTTSGYPSVAFDPAPTYDLTYDGNGNETGSAPAGTSAKTAEYITVSDNTGSLGKAGYQFNGWGTSADGTTGTNYATGSALVMGTEAVTLYTIWDKVFTIGKTKTEGGTFTVSLNGNEIDHILNSSYNGNANVNIMINLAPALGYKYKKNSLKYNDGTADHIIDNLDYESSWFIFQMPKANVVLSAEFEPAYDIDTSSLTGGSITANPNPAAAGETVDLTITPDVGKKLKAGTLKYNDGSDHLITGQSFTMPASDVTVSAEFETVSSGPGGDGGGLSDSGTTTVTGSVIDGSSGSQISNVTFTVKTNSSGKETVSIPAAQIVILKQPDGNTSQLSDISKFTITTAAGSPITISNDGTIQVPNLAKGTDNVFKMTYDLGNGQKITIGTMEIKTDSSGKVSLTTTLIDPYGIIIDEATGKALQGVNITLYYANTDRNKASGKTPDTVVSLPGIDGFKPNNNKNPQVSDINGTYGFMVFPTTDYYLVAIKDGYEQYKSPTISVEQDIVKWDFKMNQAINGVKRFSGLTRIDTALEIAKANYSGKVANVILATADNYPDALAGSVLAYKLNAPILLVGGTDADQEKVLDYMKSNLDSAGTVYILGGTGAVSGAVEAKVTASGFKHITRLGGADRYETSVKIAGQLDIKTGTPIVLVSGENYPDALSISSSAAVMQSPILLVQNDGLSDAVKQEITAIKPAKVYIIGLQGVISTAVENQVAQITGLTQTNIVRIGGADRYETSLAVAKYFNLSGQNVCLATGNDFPDALAGSVYAANYNASIILVDKTLSDNETTYLINRKLPGATILGGEGAVSQNVKQQISELMKR
ncbi:MAG: cell wall-binding repeat-containing protein [Desulfitobacteriaceae bacterium]|nr:cell wall-binding repeat-containing protein [Desulfitobacteriaceae bacterium]